MKRISKYQSKSKKLLAGVLTASILAASMSVPVFAENGPQDSSYDSADVEVGDSSTFDGFKVGTKFYLYSYDSTQISTISGITYDQSTNTVTMTNFNGTANGSSYFMSASAMGDDFTIRLVGDNYLSELDIMGNTNVGEYWSGSVTFTGTGSLTLNKDGNSSNTKSDTSSDSYGMYVDTGFTNGGVTVESGVTLTIYGGLLITSSSQTSSPFSVQANVTKLPTVSKSVDMSLNGVTYYDYEYDGDIVITGLKTQNITVKKSQLTKTIHTKKLKKKNQTFKLKATTSGNGKITYKKTSGNKKIKVSKAGKVTVKKGLKKGKTYKVKVKVTAAKTSTYKKATKTVTLKIKIK